MGQINGEAIDLFPSPFGVCVLKYRERKIEWLKAQGVSVPFRGLCSEMRRGEWGFGRYDCMFPSPFGVCVLK